MEENNIVKDIDKIHGRLNEHSMILEKHNERLDAQEERIENLEECFSVMEDKLVGIEGSLVKMEHNFLQGNSLVLQAYQTQSQENTKMMNTMMDYIKNKDNNNASLRTSKNNNKKDIIISIISGSGLGLLLSKMGSIFEYFKN